MKILSFGEILFDVIDGQEHIGGAPLNFAAHLANLGSEVAIASSIGRDKRGSTAADIVSRLGIDDSFICRDSDYPTGIVKVRLTDTGQPSYDICQAVAYDNICYSERAIEEIISLNCDALYFGTLAQRSLVSRNTLVKIASKFDKDIFFDVNLRQSYYSKKILEDSLGFATIVKLNDDELQVISELLCDECKSQKDFCRLLCRSYNVKIVILTLGNKGCLLYSEDNFLRLNAVKTGVVDTIGAGDAFSAGFLYMYLRGSGSVAAVEFANKLAADIVAQRGGIPLSYFDKSKR